MPAVRLMPCNSCPYRRDVPSGLWHRDEYERLREYDAETWAQPPEGFFCHSAPEQYCHGWAVVHWNRGHEFELLALRLRYPDDGVPEPGVPLFASGGEAADHGLADIGAPGEAAVRVIDRLSRLPWIGRD